MNDINPEIYKKAVEMTRKRGYAKISVVAGEFNIGYTHAGRIIEQMIADGIIEYKPREIELPDYKTFGFAVIPQAPARSVYDLAVETVMPDGGKMSERQEAEVEALVQFAKKVLKAKGLL